MSDPSYRLLRHNRSYRNYWTGQTISSAGAQVSIVAIPLVAATTLHGGPGTVGIVAAAGTLPYLLFSLIAGHVLQGKNQRKLMLVANLAQSLLLGVVPFMWALGQLNVPVLVVTAFLAECGALVFGVSAFSYVPELVDTEELAAANRAAQGARTVNEIAGPGLAGLLVAALGPPLAVLLDAASYIASALGIAGSRPRKEDVVASHDDQKGTILSGLKILFSTPPLRALTVHAALYNAAEQIIIVNLVVWAVKQRGVTASGYGLALAAAGLGGLIGTLIALRLADRLGLGHAFAASLGMSCGIPLLLALPTSTGVALAILIAAILLVRGIGEGNANVYSLTMRQRLIPKTQLTRSAGAYTQVMYGSIPIGSTVAGIIGQTLGARAGVFLGAVGLAISALPMLTPRFLRIRDTTGQTADPTAHGVDPAQ
jgi:MFS family permease